MSAATAPATATGNALSGGVAPEKVAAKPRKRTNVSKGTSESTELPLLATTNAAALTRARARESRMTLEDGMGLAFSRDLSVVDEGEATAPRENNTPLSTPTQKKQNFMTEYASGKGSPVKHKTVKHITHKAKEKKRSIWDTMGHLFSRLFLLFVIGAGLGTTIWNTRPRPAAPHWDVSSAEVEKLEDFVTKTTKWMQVS
jgi:hypothetical protein